MAAYADRLDYVASVVHIAGDEEIRIIFGSKTRYSCLISTMIDFGASKVLPRYIRLANASSATANLEARP